VKGLIIGGNSGIGEATFNSLSAPQLGAEWLRPTPNELDVRVESDINGYLIKHGPFTHIIYSAGVNRLNWVDKIVYGDLTDHYQVNVLGFIMIVSAHETWWPGGGVSAVAVTSDAARIPMRGSTAYCSSKAALEMAIRTMARELAPRWRINGVAPGMVEDTPMSDYIDATVPLFRDWTSEQALAYERSNVPTGRRATKNEIADTIRWLLFGPAQMTGAIIDVNGGR